MSCDHGEPDPYLPEKYCIHCNNHEHFDNPEAYAMEQAKHKDDKKSSGGWGERPRKIITRR